MISVAALEAMAAAGASAEMIVAVIKADQAATAIANDFKLADRRARDRERKRLSRTSARTPRTVADTADATQDLAEREEGAPQAAVPDNPSAADKTAGKERSPTPPKEKLSLEDSQEGTLEEGKKGSSEKARARGTRLPDDWMPSLDDLAFAAEVLPKNLVQIECDKFRDHWHAANGPPSVKRSWSAAWRNWCRRAVERRQGGNGNAQTGFRNGNRGASSGGGFARNVAEFAFASAGSDADYEPEQAPSIVGAGR